MNNPQTKICLIGGTFDPIHLGHTFIAAQAVRALGINQVIFLPCRQSPHKLDYQSVAEHHRLEMCRLAVADFPWAEISDYDLVAPAPSYSWRTVEHFRALYPQADLHWLMGTDQWEALPRWNKAQQFANSVKIIVYSRETPPVLQHGFECIALESYHHPASATSIRSSLQNKKTPAWLAPAVAHFIKENQLYLKSPLD